MASKGFIGKKTNRGFISVLMCICSVICTVLFMLASMGLSFYIGVCNSRFVEKNCINEEVAAQIGIKDDDMKKIADTVVECLKSGKEPSAIVTVGSGSVEFFDEKSVVGIMELSDAIILTKRVSFVAAIISVALMLVILIERRARILRNVFAVFWAVIGLSAVIGLILVQMNPGILSDRFIDSLLADSAVSSTNMIYILNAGLIKSAAVMEVSLFMILQLVFLVIVSRFIETRR